MACYNYDSLHYHSDHRKKPKQNKQPNCHKYKQSGHKMVDCPLKFDPIPIERIEQQIYNQDAAQLVPVQLHNLQLEHLIKYQQDSTAENLAELSKMLNLSLKLKDEIITKKIPEVGNIMLVNSIETTIVLSGMWGQNSAIISDACQLHKIRMCLMDILLSKKLIVELDECDRVSHININGDQNAYKRIDNSKIIINTISISVYENKCLQLRIGGKYYMTLIYRENIHEILNEVVLHLDNILKSINDSNEENLCVICMSNKKDIKLSPCNHMCVCEVCANGIKKCPMCRVNVIKIDKVFY